MVHCISGPKFISGRKKGAIFTSSSPRRYFLFSQSFPANNLKYRMLYNTFKYYVSCTDGKISVSINLLFYLLFIVISSNDVFLP